MWGMAIDLSARCGEWQLIQVGQCRPTESMLDVGNGY